MTNRRGRRSRQDAVEELLPLLRADLWRLKDERLLAEQPGIKALALRFQGDVWPLAWVLHVLIAGAVADVYAAACASRTRQEQRTALFLQRWFDEQRTVASIATELQLTRAHVAKTIQRPALVLIAQRVLALAELADPMAASAAVQHVLSTGRRPERPGEPRGSESIACPDGLLAVLGAQRGDFDGIPAHAH
jgi:hypothetical protein